MSVEPTTSRASEPRAWPICWPTIMLPIWRSMPMSGPAIAWASGGRPAAPSVPPIVSTMRAATGSHNCFHTGTVFSIHSDRLQACGVTTPLGSAVTSLSHRSARLRASAIWRRSPSMTLGSPSATTACRAMFLAISQLTGPASGDADSMSANCRMAAAICSGLPNMAKGLSLGSFSRPGRSVTAPPRAGWRSPHPPRYPPWGGSVQSEDLVPTSKRLRPLVVAVTGAASGTGRAFLARVASSAEFRRVVAIDDHRGDVSAVPWRVLDIRDPLLATRISDVDVLVHLGTDESLDSDPSERRRYNIRAAQTVLTACAAARVRRVV